jgi:hypothetical protein
LAAAVVAGSLPARAGDTIVDSFEDGSIDTRIWNLFQAPPERVWIDRDHHAFGRASLAIQVEPSDDGRFCRKGCQRIEVREANAIQLPSGTDVWYAFSFKLDGHVPRLGSTRWVVGQWKQQTVGIDPSPFLAQRFDNGVFHLTVQDRGCRSVIATAEGDYSALLVLQRAFALPPSGMLARLGFPESRATTLCSTDVDVEPGEVEHLPDPQKGWVRMAYRLEAAREGSGSIDVYADGRFVTRAMGSIGYPTSKGARQYFKMGHYRDTMPGSATLYFDCFVRAFSREEAFDTSRCGPPSAP